VPRPSARPSPLRQHSLRRARRVSSQTCSLAGSGNTPSAPALHARC
jgi:hypothetical protein